jgi:ribose-phosphate pyrophosphokinase
VALPGFTVVCSGHGCEAARSAAERLGAELVEAYTKTFPDGERYVRVLAGLEGRVALVVTTGYPEPSERVLEAMLLAEAARGLGAASVIAAPLYLPYSRQDRRFLRGEPVSVRAVLRGLAAAGAEALATVDVHKEYSLDWFPGPAANIDPSPAFAEALRPLLGGDTVYVIGPDRGAVARAHRLAERLGAALDYLEKHRDRVTGEVSLRPKTVDVQGATVVLVDDIVSTGGTLAKAARLLYSQGARRVLAAVTHCLLADAAAEKLQDAGLEALLCANTVKPCWSRARSVDIGPLLADAARRLAERLHGYEAEAPAG